MPRLPQELIERIKKEASLEDLCREYGIELQGSGKNRMGKCPFHDDHDASFAVTPSKNLWNCLAGCGGGDPIQLVMRMEKASFRKAAEKLATKIGAGIEIENKVEAISVTHEILADPDGTNERELLNIVTDYYHQSFLNQPAAMQYLQKRKCFHPEAVKTFKLGYANRTLGYRIPATIQKGKDLKAKLQKVGIIRESGHEHLNGSVVFPLFDAEGNTVQMYGRKIVEKLRKGTPKHLYLEGAKRGIWNREGILGKAEWLLCECLIDALTLWSNGQKNVTCAFGVNGMNQDLWKLLEKNPPERVVICYDHDKAGNEASETLTKQLAEKGIGVRRVQLPEGYDINQLAQESQQPSTALAAVIEEARCTVTKAKTAPISPAPSSLAATTPRNEGVLDRNEVTCPEGVSPACGLDESKMLEAKKEAVAVESIEAPKPKEKSPLIWKGEDVFWKEDLREYRVRGLHKNLSYSVLKIQLRVMQGERFHLDSFDLCSYKQREQFTRVATDELKARREEVKKELGMLLMHLEEAQEKIIEETLKPQKEEIKIEDEDRGKALALLRDPQLVERIITDFETCGLVGERTNKLVGYLAATSRKFDKPLGVIIQSTSAAGKTTLMEAVLSFFPEEEQIKYSALTGQALFYLGESDIRHKILGIAEEEGAERATYALKLLQSEGELTIASTGKDATTGRMQTEEYHVQGPAMIFFTTTSIEIDEELQNRCLTLTVDESREQTRRIHALQREAETIEGHIRREEKKKLLEIHRNAQRLLRPLPVHNPYASKLTFPDENTRLRRDQTKYLTLIRTVALLHQYQREIKKEANGTEYLEVTLEDIQLANQLTAEVLGRSLDELPPQTRRFLERLFQMVSKEAQEKDLEQKVIRFTQREARDFTGMSQMQVKRHLSKLVELEYVLPHRSVRGQQYKYELLYEGQGQTGEAFLLGLLDTQAYDDKWGSKNEGRVTAGAPQVHPKGMGGAEPKNDSKLIQEKEETLFPLESLPETQPQQFEIHA